LDNINIDLREVGMTGFLLLRTRARSWGSSVSIVFVYRLEFDPRQKLRFFCIFFVQTGSKTNPASCTMGTGGPSSEIERGRGVTLTTHPINNEVKNEYELYVLSSLAATWLYWDSFTF
jgi:hypothetical protein